MNLNIAVIGSGIIGLTSASQILEKIPNAKITIFYKDKSPNTTSDVSAGSSSVFSVIFVLLYIIKYKIRLLGTVLLK